MAHGRRRSGRQSHRPWPLSGAKLRSTDRKRNAGITQSVLLRGAAQLANHSSRFLAERSADFVADTTPHNRDRLSGPKYADRTKSHAVSRWQRETAAAPSAEKGESIIPICAEFLG